MASGNPRLPMAAIGGALVISLFCIFTLASAARYPGPFSPLDNWLSDLGTASKNPQGFMYFNTGCILTGISLLVFIWGMGAWRPGDKGKASLFDISRASGILSSFALMLIGAFDEDTPYHTGLSIAFFLIQLLFIALANISLWSHPSYNKWIGYYSILVIIINLVLAFTFFAYEHAPVWEWLAVFSAMLWVALLAYNTLKLEAWQPS